MHSRPGTAGIEYSDGDGFEERLLGALRRASDLGTFSDELASLIVDWPSEASLSPIRSNLLRPLSLTPAMRVLEVGAGCGALTRWLGEAGMTVEALEGAEMRAACAAERCRDLENVRVIRDRFSTYRTSTQYDVITLIGVLEYARLFELNGDPVQSLLTKARSLLAPSGAIVLAIENQLGLKYFNGCSEDHLGTPFAGLCDLYGTATPVTFGRAELERRLRDAGFRNLSWYLPFPDYKLPSTVIAERALEHPEFSCGDLLFGEYARDYAGSTLRAFDEAAVWPVLARNGLLRELANSFLVVATTGGANPLDIDTTWLARRYSTFRTRNFAASTSFIMSANGTVEVRKERLRPTDEPEGTSASHHFELREGRAPYLRGCSFAHRFAEAVARGHGPAGIAAELMPWIGYLIARTEGDAETTSAERLAERMLPGEFVDCTPFNLLVTESGKLQSFDLELVADRPIPLAWVVLRGVVHTATRCFGQRYLNGRSCASLVGDLLPRLGFGNIDDWSPYYTLEDELIRAVLRPWPGRGEHAIFATRLGLPAVGVHSEAEALRTRCAESESRESSVRAEIAAIRARLTDREHAYDSLAAQYALSIAQGAAVEANLAAVQATLAAQKLEFEHVHAEAANLSGQYAQALLRIGSAEGELTSKKLELEHARTETANLLGQYAQVLARIGSTERDLAQRSAESEARMVRVTELGAELDRTRTESAQLLHQIAEARERTGFEMGRAEALERALADARRRRTLRDRVWRGLRALYRAVPMGPVLRERAKSAFYRSFGRWFVAQPNYQLWRAIRASVHVKQRHARNDLTSEASAILAPRSTADDSDRDPEHTFLSRVSVVIPAYGNAGMIRRCIESVLRSRDGPVNEVIVIDDASPEPIAPSLLGLDLVSVVRNDTNLGFVGTCNRGAALARGSLVLFLNSDAEVAPGAITAMARTFDDSPKVGIVGCKLVFPDGRLQEAGCAIDREGNAQMIGLWDDPTRPCYGFTRDVAYCSGACLMIERELFNVLKGFDMAFAPAYCEDSDLCFRARALGRRVVYQPDAKVVHALSASIADAPFDKKRLVKTNQARFVGRWHDVLLREDRVRAIAMYLPQYHPIPENDQWWGAGFTEWNNVRRARPSFEGHVQPNVPAAYGFYDLRDAAIRAEQARLAREAGFEGFCYYYYWFGGRRLLNAPLDAVLASGEPDFPFCLCWANENWTRRWDGLESEVLIAQQHSDADDLAFFESILPALRDRRYLTVNGKPLLLVYRPALFPDARATAARWRDAARRANLPGLYLASVQSFFHLDSRGPEAFGFDAAVEFPPHSFAVERESLPLTLAGTAFEGKVYDYAMTAKNFSERELPPYRLFRGVMPRWDNTPRRGAHANVFVGATPEAYRDWLERTVRSTRSLLFGDERLLFVNAWNEWGEGNYLEPDEQFGSGYLDATRSVLTR